MEPCENGIINLWDLPEDEVYVSFDKKFTVKMLETAKKLSGGKWVKLARNLRIPLPKDKSSTTLRYLRRYNLINLKNLKKLSDYLVNKGYKQYSLKTLQKKILLIKTNNSQKGINNPKFPINFNSKEGAIIISCMFHDGGICKRDISPFYANFSSVLKERFVDAVKNLVGDTPYFSRKKEVSFPKILGLILILLGLVPGKKPINNPKFPEFVFNYPEDLILEFLSQAIADDGWIHNPKKGFGFVGFNFTIDLTRFSKKFRKKIKNEKLLEHLPNVLLGNIKLFKKLGCSVAGPLFSHDIVYNNKDGSEKRYTQEWRMQVRGYNNFKYLAENMKIPLDYKQEKLISENNKIRLRKV